ncbi:MAG: PrsW family intramembrane metalloprotease [Candidatus Colwellbacteria bacterium]|nr:PrsW family intramembrane metalloprotease [Candidatus Colwellbacteria bacterium]MBI3088750.1 PrsW family intramembrane metalloprotease [Candidatus Colwellbacteria bacterium]
MVIIPSVLGLLPAVLWLLFFLREDASRPEPRRMIIYVFIGGALAAGASVVPEFYLQKYFPPSLEAPSYASPLLPLFALIEEVAKFLIVYLIIKKSAYFDEGIDAMIYMITAGLGFAAVENILNLTGAESVLETFALRSIGATLLHALASGILGFHWIRGYLVPGIVAATLLHWAFNYFVLIFQNIEIYTTGLLLLAAIFLFHDFEILKARDKMMARLRRPQNN